MKTHPVLIALRDGVEVLVIAGTETGLGLHKTQDRKRTMGLAHWTCSQGQDPRQE